MCSFMHIVLTNRYNDLNIVTNTTSLPWYDLINQASAKCSIKLTDDLESYLVLLLVKFMQDPSVLSGAMAIDFLNSQNMYGQNRSNALRNVGDKCLLLTGLFPAYSRRKRVKLSYYIAMGQSAYRALADNYNNINRKLFIQLVDQFVDLVDVLQATRKVDQNNVDLLLAAELCNETNSEYSKMILTTYTNGKFIFPSPNPDTRH